MAAYISFESMDSQQTESLLTPMHEIISAADKTGALFIGSMQASVDTELLKSHEIRHIVQCLGRWPVPYPDEFDYYNLEIDDSEREDLSPHLDEVCTFIKNHLGGGENVLVQCQQGVSRSAAIIIAYLIRDRGLSYDDAFKLLKGKRPCVKPNPGFVAALRRWEEEVACVRDPSTVSRVQ